MTFRLGCHPAVRHDNDEVSVGSGQLRGVLDARDVARLSPLNNRDRAHELGELGHQADTGSTTRPGSPSYGHRYFRHRGERGISGSPSPSPLRPAPGQPETRNALAIANLEQAPNMLAGLRGQQPVVNAFGRQRRQWHCLRPKCLNVQGWRPGRSLRTREHQPAGAITFTNGTGTVAVS
jgi:hypothetical protein